MKNSEHVVVVIPKGSRNEVRATFSVRDNRPVIDIRQFEPNGLRVLMPTMKGVGNIDLAAACEIARAILRFDAGCRS
jgi:hypothetical protein